MTKAGPFECVACGACCAAPDISTLNKPLGVACRHLQADCRCAIYADRPPVCRNYQPDWICAEVAPLPTLEARVVRFLEIYGLSEEAGYSGKERKEAHMGHDELKGEPYLGARLAEQRDVFRRSTPEPEAEASAVERESRVDGRAIRDRFVRGGEAVPPPPSILAAPDGSLEAHLESRLAEIQDTFGKRRPAPRGAHAPDADALETYRRLRRELGS